MFCLYWPGISLNAIIGDDGIITNSQIASIESKFAGYKEELETNIVSKAEGDREKVNLLNENVKTYIPSIDENDIGKFAVIGGELYYLGNDELLKKAAQNQKMEVMDSGVGTESSVSSKVEEKAIESMVKNSGENVFKRFDEESGELVEIGEKLISKSLFEAWRVVNEFNDKTFQKSYGDGWYYIKKGTNIDGLGNLKKGYIINFTEDEVIIFDDNKHLFLDSKDKLAVTDNIVLNIDPSSLSNQNEWGNNFTLHGVNNFNEFCNGTELNFDGKDDYLEIKVDNSNLKGGITMEFYGKLKATGGEDTWPLLCKTREDDDGFSGRFRSALDYDGTFSLCAGVGDCGSDWRHPNPANPHWIKVNLGRGDRLDGVIYFTLVIDLKSSQITIFVDGHKLGPEGGDPSWLINGKLDDATFPFTVGAMRGGEDRWILGGFSLYSCRLYSRPLTDGEVNDNYLKTVSFHNAETGGK